MFISKKKHQAEVELLQKQLKSANQIIQNQQDIIQRQEILTPTMQSLVTVLQNYEKEIYDVTQNEVNYIHAFFKTILGMINQNKLTIISDAKKEIEKVSKLYIDEVLQPKGE